MTNPLKILTLAVVAVAIPFASAKRLNVIIDARASEEYMAASESLEYQTYHFIKGAHYEGNYRDRELEDSEFEDIAESLVKALKNRNYYTEPDKELGDLMILVSYGITSVDTDYTELMGAMSADEIAPAEANEGALSVQSVNALGETMIKARPTALKKSNMKMLGFEKGLDAAFNRFDGTNTLEDSLTKERYFVVLNAFDYQLFLKNGELEQVWSVRYSTQAQGIGFKVAFDEMNDSVSGVFGLQVDKLTTVRGDTSNSHIGELEVISTVEEGE